MAQFVALLRGINVGKAKRIAMADLRVLLEGLGYSDVSTLLNSGNAVFSAGKDKPAKLAADIAAAIADQMGFEVPVIVKSAQEFTSAVTENSITVDESEHPRLLVVFVQDDKALPNLSPVTALLVPPERFAIGAHAAYLHCAIGILESKAGEALVGKIGRSVSVTSRNWATVLKLRALLDKA
ncbi:MAG TPA: DUF1697 domain-containing protein [Burkholderiaceae bacterium]